MTIEQLINVLVAVTLFEMMMAVGLGVPSADLVRVARNVPLLAKAVIANYLCVPVAAVALLLLFRAQPMVAAGFLILAVCPGAPFGPPCTAIAKGNVAVSVGLMVLLAGSSALVAPLLLGFLLPLISDNESLKVDPVKLAATLLLTQLIPLCAGLIVRQWRPALAIRLQKPANRLSALLNLTVVGFILATQFGTLAAIRPRAWAGMAALLIVSLAVGWLLGGPGTDNRKAMTLTTSLRNVGVGLVIAASSFPGTAALTATLAYGLFELSGSFLLAFRWGRPASVHGPKSVDSKNATIVANAKRTLS
jgi:bile acid:Na+ symporter, BASS family